MSEYERLTMEEGDHDDRRYRQRALQRWRLSMLLSFSSGVLVAMVAYPRLQPCPDLHSVMAVTRCPACPVCLPSDTDAIVSKAVESAVARCPSCPKCPEFPGCPACPATTCPRCDLKCPQLPPRAVLPDADVAARHRLAMLARPMRNILECSPGAMDGACRMGLSRRFKVLGQKGATLWMTGLSGAGKTTITKALEKRLLLAMRKNVYNIDGDNLRTGLTCARPRSVV